MHGKTQALVLAHVAVLLSTVACAARAGDESADSRDQAARSSEDRSTDYDSFGRPRHHDEVQLGVRPYYLVEGMDPGKLKDKLLSCENGPFHRTDFSIGHRGAGLQIPEHTRESYSAAARMGAGIVECDVTFTSDGALVCRHDECDLATTTNIVTTPLNSQCSVPWSGAGFYYLFDPMGQAVKKDSDMYKALDVLAKKVGILGIFSDWPATVTYYANCMGLK